MIIKHLLKFIGVFVHMFLNILIGRKSLIRRDNFVFIAYLFILETEKLFRSKASK